MDSFFKNSYLDHKPDKVPKRASSDLASPSQPLTIAIAISGSNKSKNVVKWALKKFASDKNVVFKLIHVQPKLTSLPTPSGNTVSISEAPEDVAATYRQKVMQETKETLLKPFKKMCERKKVAVELQVLESNRVAVAITREVNEHLISNLFIGSSSHGNLSKNHDITAQVSAFVSNLCTVYVVSKGVSFLSKDKVSSDTERHQTLRDSGNERTDSSSWSSGSGPNSDVLSNTLKSNPHSLSKKGLQHLPTIIRGVSVPMETSSAESGETRSVSEEVSKRNSPETSRSVSWNPRFRDFDERQDVVSSMSMSSNHEYGNVTQGGDYFTDDQETLKEITKLRAELRHAQEMYAVAQVETLDASRKLNELKFEELTLMQQKTKGLAEKETQMTLFEKKRREEREAAQRIEAEMKATREAKAKEKLEESSLVAAPKLQYQEFTWEEITTATSSFSEELKIGMGAYGAVYKCNLHHTIAAVKVLHSAENSLSKQFDQELEILSKISHPHLVLLLGACPEHGALVYEYMENGSLEDRLFQVKNSQPIPWFVRFRIAWEVASALVFLHKSKPTPIIHRDLKPANILLDHNFVSKVGDVGLSTMIQVDPLLTQFTMYKQTSPVGTLCYIDPEYQRTGRISPKSDVYAFGMIILQLLTAQPAMALTYTVEIAMENNNDDELIQILDQKAGKWPIEETRQLAALALCCTELRSKDRPDLKDQILPALESLKKVADKAKNSLSAAPSQPPSHFLCPLLKDVMKDPCIAADGYSYDRQAIMEWMENHRTSPVTNSLLQNVNLLPNHTLYAAIVEWRNRNQ
ncbi:PREDICTED: putative U-box domain-containing protein 53 [Camelina sativa]|uniref:RING-type E3 ubiquitin transferase n=1 Tax=Camelina sativa TaxID=90675 RepID=A0ABM1QMU0_CAMSA|nr:PREDICTED: putative U-box domain-containing protein 53 [Camelina sativa]